MRGVTVPNSHVKGLRGSKGSDALPEATHAQNRGSAGFSNSELLCDVIPPEVSSHGEARGQPDVL